MRFISKHNIILLFILLLFTKTQAQSLSGYALNMGGGYSSTMEWSIGESVSIAHFISAGYSLNTGVLQPITTSSTPTAISEYGPLVFGNQITVGPNPTSKLLRIKAIFNEVGSLSFQLIDSRSAIILTQEAGTIFNGYEKISDITSDDKGKIRGFIDKAKKSFWIYEELLYGEFSNQAQEALNNFSVTFKNATEPMKDILNDNAVTGAEK